MLRSVPLDATSRPDLRTRLVRLGLMRIPTLWGVMDQGVIAIGNVAIGLLILHLSTKAGYGLYTLAYMTVITATGFASALFTTPMVTAYFECSEPQRRALAARALAAQLQSTAPVALAAAAGAVLLLDGDARTIATVAALACMPATAQDFTRSYLFLTGRGQWALALDVALLVLWGGATLALIACGVPASVAGLVSYGVATAATALPALTAARLLTLSRDTGSSVGALARQGRWTLTGALVTAVQNQGYVYMTGVIAHPSAVADMNAARMLISPIGLVIAGANRTLLPALARNVAEGRQAAADRSARQVLIALLLAIGGYVGLLWLFQATVIGAVLGPRYAAIGTLVGLWSAIVALQAIDYNLSARLQAAKRYRALAMVNLWTSLPTLAAAMPMIAWFGVVGGLVVSAASYLAVVLWLWWLVAHGGDADAVRGR